MSLKLGGDIDGIFVTLFTLDIGKSSYTWFPWISLDCSTYYGHLGNPQIQLAALGSI
jgi:hypothetical protein